MLQVKYLHARPLFRTPGLSVRGVGVHEVMPPSFVQRPRGTGDYLFMLFHDAVRWGPAPGTRDLPPGTVVLWGRGAGHYYGNPAARWSHSWVHCDGEQVRQLLRRARAACGRPRVAADPARIDQHLYDLHEELAGPHRPDAVIVRNTLENLVRQAARGDGQLQRRAIPEAMLRVKRIIDTGYDRRLALRELAREADVSIPHLCTEFRRHFGVPPIAYLIRRRMHAAATLLRETATPVGEVGRRVGCDDPFHFSKLFKACFGVPPSSLRRAGAPRRTPPAR